VLTNRTRGYAYATMEIGVAYATDVRPAISLCARSAWRCAPTRRGGARIAEDLDVQGVERLDDSAVILRSRLKVVPAIEQWNVPARVPAPLQKASTSVASRSPPAAHRSHPVTPRPDHAAPH